jgi:hypothetical protein
VNYTTEHALVQEITPSAGAGQWMTLREYVMYEHVSRRTVYNWLAKGLLVTRRTPGGRLRVWVKA